MSRSGAAETSAGYLARANDDRPARGGGARLNIRAEASCVNAALRAAPAAAAAQTTRLGSVGDRRDRSHRVILGFLIDLALGS